MAMKDRIADKRRWAATAVASRFNEAVLVDPPLGYIYMYAYDTETHMFIRLGD